MHRRKNSMISLLVCFAVLPMMVSTARAGEDMQVRADQLEKAKAFFDDPSPMYKNLDLKQFMTQEEYDSITFDIDEMKKAWAEVVGFKAPDKVGKIELEIKEGKYTWRDKEKHPGLKKLMMPLQYGDFKTGGPPFGGGIPEFEVIPTRQYYYALPISEATKKHAASVKQDEQGYLVQESYIAGFPFPRPSGKHKAIQIMYNWDKRYFSGENMFLLNRSKGFDKNLREDRNSFNKVYSLRMNTRVISEPLGWYDEGARKRGERQTFNVVQLQPRDSFGNVVNVTTYTGAKQFDQMMVYAASLRRVRKLSGTDTQDIAVGVDAIYEDSEYFNQKLTPHRFPYDYNVVDEREYLVPAVSDDGSEYFTESGLEVRGMRFERRPLYVLELNQLDKNFVYGRRMIYFDQETFIIHCIENYDQKDRLYRSYTNILYLYHEFGIWTACVNVNRDHIDTHTTLGIPFQHPVTWITRDHTSMRGAIKRGK